MDQINSSNYESIPLFSITGFYTAKVVYCYDGDTVHVVMPFMDGIFRFKVRLLEYNSCEMNPKKGTYTDEEDRERIKTLAMNAKNKIEELVLNQTITLYSTGYDCFGRLLCLILPGGISTVSSLSYNELYNLSYNKIMLDGGYGEVY